MALTQVPIELSSTPGIVDNSNATAITIASSENVGIGTSSPARKLTIQGGSGDTLPVRVIGGSGTTTGGIEFQDASTTADYKVQIGSIGDNLYLRAGGAERVRVTSAGRVGIGTTNPSDTLSVNGAVFSSDKYRLQRSSGSLALNVMEYWDGSGSPLSGNKGDILAIGNQGGDGLALVNSGAERMRIDSSGNVLVNDTATSAPGLGVSAGKNISFSENSTSLSYANIFRQASSAALMLTNGYVYTGTANKAASSVSSSWARSAIAVSYGRIQFFTDPASTVAKDTDITPTEVMRIDSSGNLLVGTTSTPNGTSVYGAGFINTGASGLVQWLSGTSTTSAVSVARFYNPNGNVGSIQLSGSATSYVTSSDQRLKENITDADDAGSKVDAIQVRKFDWIADGSHQNYGMIAQELQAVAPEAVSAPEDPDEMMGVDYSKLVPMLVKEIQSLRTRVAQLENN